MKAEGAVGAIAPVIGRPTIGPSARRGRSASNSRSSRADCAGWHGGRNAYGAAAGSNLDGKGPAGWVGTEHQAWGDLREISRTNGPARGSGRDGEEEGGRVTPRPGST